LATQTNKLLAFRIHSKKMTKHAGCCLITPPWLTKTCGDFTDGGQCQTCANEIWIISPINVDQTFSAYLSFVFSAYVCTEGGKRHRNLYAGSLLCLDLLKAYGGFSIGKITNRLKQTQVCCCMATKVAGRRHDALTALDGGHNSHPKLDIWRIPWNYAVKT
jgi:hypothetical protein